MIEVLNKEFEAICKRCFCTLKFTSEDVKNVGTHYSGKRGSHSIYGIKCPNCNSVVRMDGVTPIIPPPPPPPPMRVIAENFSLKDVKRGIR